MDEVGVVLAAPGHGAAPRAEALIRAGSLAHPHAIGFAAGTVEGIA